MNSSRLHRRTKIVATLGPASDSPGVLERMIAAGVDVVRLNFSHGVAEDHARRAAAVRDIAARLEVDVGILADLQGPKIRIERFKDGSIELQPGSSFALDTALDPDAGDAGVVGCSYQDLPKDVAEGDVLVLDDGAISLQVMAVRGTRVECTVLLGGRLSGRKGINKQGGGLSAPALTDKDREDIVHAANLGADFVAVSFPRSARDMRSARALVRAAGSDAALVAKIERSEALLVLTEIVEASDAVMVARGDLGVEIGDAELPGWQKRIIAEAREQNRLVITATQMMESMIEHPTPTRAEVMDVANAVIDGTDAVMLSAETASGNWPVKVVEAMVRICVGAERSKPVERKSGELDAHFVRADEAIAMATAWTALHMHAKAVLAMTESGATALMMSRTETEIPIYALSPSQRTRQRMALCRGVYPMAFDIADYTSLAPVREACELLRQRGLVKAGDRVLVTRGDGAGAGGTNTLKIVQIGSDD